MINEDEIGVILVAHRCQFSGSAVRRAYDAALVAFHKCGLPPNRLAARAPGIGSNYANFDTKRRLLERADFAAVQHFTISRLATGGRFPGYEWDMLWSLDKSTSDLVAAYVPGPAIENFEAVDSEFLDAVKACNPRYGYRMRQQLLLAPLLYVGGSHLFHPSNRRESEVRSNVSWWGYSGPQGFPQDSSLLRDVFLENYLSESYLHARLGKSATTLKEWILADRANRGTLEPYTDTLTNWTPPIEKIPEIREELYRAGRVFYWRFFCPGHGSVWSTAVKPEPLYRPDLSAPWEAPDPIPEIYRADYWKDKDPGLTY